MQIPEKHNPEEIAALKALIEEGLASGVCEEDAETIIERIIAERPARQKKE